MVPMYAFDGGRIRDYSMKTVLWLESVDSITVRRKNGRIVSARFRATAIQHTIPSTATGLSRCRHTVLEQVGTRRVIQHRRLPYAALSRELTPEERERIMRAAYAAVTVSVLGG